MTGFFVVGDSGSTLRLRVLTVVRGRVVDVAPTTLVFDGDTTLSSVDAAYLGCRLRFVTGRLADGGGEFRNVTVYEGATRQFTVDEAFSVVPIDGDEFELTVPINLTGKTVKLAFALNDAVATVVAPTLSAPADGVITHKFSAAELGVEGTMAVQVEFADDAGGTNKVSTEVKQLPVIRKLV